MGKRDHEDLLALHAVDDRERKTTQHDSAHSAIDRAPSLRMEQDGLHRFRDLTLEAGGGVRTRG